ncbi:MAG: hypothetical protein IKO22_07310 [Oscillospiraceae bacterium]|nr:hypothetical protein [Oscillospiraceae bacterium]
MNYKIERVEKLTVGTSASTVKVRGLACLIQNNSDSATVYFKEKRDDGKAATASNGYAIAPGGQTTIPLVAMELSVAASAASTDVRVLILDTE